MVLRHCAFLVHHTSRSILRPVFGRYQSPSLLLRMLASSTRLQYAYTSMSCRPQTGPRGGGHVMEVKLHCTGSSPKNGGGGRGGGCNNEQGVKARQDNTYNLKRLSSVNSSRQTLYSCSVQVHCCSHSECEGVCNTNHRFQCSSEHSTRATGQSTGCHHVVVHHTLTGHISVHSKCSCTESIGIITQAREHCLLTRACGIGSSELSTYSSYKVGNGLHRCIHLQETLLCVVENVWSIINKNVPEQD